MGGRLPWFSHGLEAGEKREAIPGKAFWGRWRFSGALVNLKFVFLESKAVVDWKKEDPCEGWGERQGRPGFGCTFPKNDLRFQTG